jgi:hypothetical protein
MFAWVGALFWLKKPGQDKSTILQSGEGFGKVTAQVQRTLIGWIKKLVVE